jgi:hypothetical protein
MSDEKPIEWRDVMGREVQPGMTVAYATEVADSTTIKLGRVVELKSTTSYGGRSFPKLKLITVENRWGNGWQLQSNGRTVTLSLAAAMVIPRKMAPPEALSILDARTPADLLSVMAEQEAALGIEISMAADKDLRADDMPNNLSRP